MVKNKLLSGRVKVTPSANVTEDRYSFLGLEQAEPNLGQGTEGYVLTYDPNSPGERAWAPGGVESAAAFDRANSSYETSNSAGVFANAAFIHANSAYEAANNAVDTWVRDQANNAFDSANTAQDTADAAFDSANTAQDTADSAFNAANTAQDTADAAFNSANTAQDTAGAAFDSANTAQDTADAAFDSANTAQNTADAAFDAANTAQDTADSAFNAANTAQDTADAAFDTANTKYDKTGGEITGDVLITGNLTVSGNVTSIEATNLSVEDNMIYLNANNTVTNPDLGFAGNYNDGTYAHAGLFRDASDGVWKFYDGYTPEPDESPYIDTTNASFHIATVQANITSQLVNIRGLEVGYHANAAYNTANAAFEAANNSVDTWVRDQANGAFDAANSSGVFANAAFIHANAAFDAANNAVDTWVRDQANGAFDAANSSGVFANSAYDHANAAFDTANNATDTWVRDQANSSYNHANSAFDAANAVYDYANSTFAVSSTLDSFTGDSACTTFTLSITPPNENYTFVTLNGLVQHKSAYNVSGSNVVFSEAPGTDVAIDVVTLTGTATIPIGVTITLDTFTGDNSCTTFALTTTPLNENYTSVVIDGVSQLKTAYNISGSSIVFSEAPGTDTNIEVTTYQSADEYVANTLAQIARDHANSAYLHANSAFDAANNSVDTWVRDQANAAFNAANTAQVTADAAFDAANNAVDTWVRDQANSAFNAANTAQDTADAAFGAANTAQDTADAAFGAANTAQDTADSAFNSANTAQDTADAAFGAANTAQDTADAAFDSANTAQDTADAAFGAANTAQDTADAAFDYANTYPSYVDNAIANLVASAPTTLDTLNELATALNNDPSFATTTATLIGLARDQANSAFDAANTADQKAVTSGSYANSAYLHANAAFDAANNAVDTWVRDQANGAFDAANTGTILAQAAFDAANNSSDTWVRGQANSAFDKANAAYDYANGTFAVSSTLDSFTGDNACTTFTLSTTPSNENYTFVTLNGLVQHKSAYNVSGSNIVFSEAPNTDVAIDVVTLTGNPVITVGVNITVDSFTGDAACTEFTLTTEPKDENYILVSVSGTLQHKSAYSLSGTTLTFSEAPPDSATIEVSIYESADIYASNTLSQIARDHANAAYDAANNAVDTWVRDQANLAFDAANTAQDTADLAFGQANTGTTIAQAAYDEANTKYNQNGGEISGDVTITGNLTVSGNVFSVEATNLNIEDNMFYLNANSAVTNPDLGFAGNYNDGTYAHAGLFRDASDGVWKFFDSYLPEPDESPYIDTSNASFNIATVQADIISDSLTLRGIEIGNYANSSYVHANAAFNAANNATDTWVRNQANLAFDQANTGTILAQAAYDAANTAQDTADAAFDSANTAQDTADLAFDQANTGTILAQAAFDSANTAQDTADAAFDSANTASSYANSAYIQANTGTILAQAAFDAANTAGGADTYAREHANSAYDAANTALGGQELYVASLDNFTSDGSNTEFTLSVTPANVSSMFVYVDGVYQQASAYTLDGNTLTLSEALDANSILEVRVLANTTPSQLFPTAFNTTVDTFSGDNSTTEFTLSTTPIDENHTFVFLNGVYQEKSTYSISGANVVLTGTATSNDTIEVATVKGSEINVTSSQYNSRVFTGDSACTEFTIASGHSANSILVFENGICQEPITDYTVSGTTLTFTTAPATGVKIQIRELPV